MTVSKSGRRRAEFSVVIPAHDEGAVIERCLSFVRDLEPGEAEVVVVANGCGDDTAVRARAVPGVRVVEMAAQGKVAALNAGDAAVRAFPRVYLDADVVVDAEILRTLVDVLGRPEPLVGAPRPQFVTDRSSLPVRLFFQAYRRLPYVNDKMVGSGLMALNAAGRARFDAFPQVTGDDLFVQRQFRPEETLVPDGAVFQVHAPCSLAGLLAVRTRIARGNAELADLPHVVGYQGTATARTTGATVAALVRLVVREPQLLPAAVVFTAVTALTRTRARSRPSAQWERDHSSRAAAVSAPFAGARSGARPCPS